MRTRSEILRDLRAARQRNIAVYARMAEEVPKAELLGWRARKPEDPDVTMLIVEKCLDHSPALASRAIAEVNENDEEITRLSRELERATRHYVSPPEPQTTKSAVLLPGGGILHAYAAREALALGLVPVVTDKDKDCPCAKIQGVEFHEIDCYDTESHVALAAKLKGRLIGAFCGGADTHVQVAAVHEAMGWEGRWVSRKTATICKDKEQAKDALLAAAVPTAAYRMEPPCICKPRVGSGSRGVKRLLIRSEANRACGNYPDALHEELLEGPEQSVEILLRPGAGPLYRVNIVDRHFVWVDDQPLEVGHTNPTRLDAKTQGEIYALCYAAAEAVGATVGFFKCDTILTKDGPKVLECSPRLSGGFDSQISTPASSGRNLLRYGLQLACGLPTEAKLLDRRWDERVTVIHRPHLATPDLFRGR